MSSELEELYQEVLLDHSRRPRNFGEIADATVRVHGDNPSCGDEIHLFVRLGDDKAVIEDLKFTGQGCAISRASASMMTMKLKGKPVNDALALLHTFRDLLVSENVDAEGLGDLRLLGGVRKFPQRVKCAMLAWRALEQALTEPGGEQTISTEVDQVDQPDQ